MRSLVTLILRIRNRCISVRDIIRLELTNHISRMSANSNLHRAKDKKNDEFYTQLPDVTNNKGIYAYLLTGEEKHLNIRTFNEKDKLRKYNEQEGVCAKCGNHFAYTDMDGDHILPWSKGGKTEYDNLQMLCISCNRSNL